MIKNIIFDLGGVLIDWNPDYLYRKIITDEEKRKEFLSTVCTPDWNEMQDAGRTIQRANEILVEKFPDFKTEILAFYGRWEEMLGGVFDDTVDVLNILIEKDEHQIYALTNWSAETFPIAWDRYEFLKLFKDILVSGRVKLKKPDPKIYQLAIERFEVIPEETVFIDDNERNIRAAEKEGIKGIVYRSTADLKAQLESFGIRVG